jgi:hypothetical protein
MPTAEQVRDLARNAANRWSELHLIHRIGGDQLTATIRHGALEVYRESDGYTASEAGPTPSSWTVRPLEPIYESYRWAAMLDPYELSHHVGITNIDIDLLHDRPVWTFLAQAEDGYDPICSCCPLVFSEESQRLEFGADWIAPSDLAIPDGVEISLDVETGIVVESRDMGAVRPNWFQNQIVSCSIT